MPPKKRKEGGEVASAAVAPKTAGSGKDAMKVPQNVSFGDSFLKDAPFTCTLCKSRIDKGTQTLSHFKNHHKITKPAAIEKLVTLGVVLYDPPDDVASGDYPTATKTTPKSKPSNRVVNKTPSKTPTSGSGVSNTAKAKSSQQVAPEAPVTGPYVKGDIVLAHITGYPWWPGIVQRLELDRQGELLIDIRFFDKDMMTGKVKVASIKDFKDYQQYLKSKRKAFGAATLGKLRQAHEFALKVRSKPASWRHTYFCVEKHTMFDYNANHDTTEIEEEPLTRRQQQQQTTSLTSDNKKANSSSSKRPAAAAAPAEAADKEAGAAAAAKTAKLDHQEEAATSKNEESSEVPEPAASAADPVDNDDESDFDEDGCENDVNDVLNEMGYDN